MQELRALETTTCIWPMKEEQPLTESPVWIVMTQSAKKELEPELLDVRKNWREQVEEFLKRQMKALDDAEEGAEKDVEGKSILHGLPVGQNSDVSVDLPRGSPRPERPRPRAASSSSSGRERLREWLLRLTDKEVARKCSSLHWAEREPQLALDLAAGVHVEVQPGRRLEDLASFSSHRHGQNVTNEGLECRKACEPRDGENCRSGFCGSGSCCRRGEPDPACPNDAGCEGYHCCAAPRGAQLAPCRAKPGYYCLSSLMSEDPPRGMRPVEACALLRTVLACPPGFFCPGGGAVPRACRRGMRCPPGSAEQTRCPRGYFCPISIWQKRCPPGTNCKEGAVAPKPCRVGSYCPNGTSATCPAGHFCTEGSWRPTPCATLARCGSTGGGSESWHHLAFPALFIVSLLWALMMRATPLWLKESRGSWGARSCSPASVSLVCLALAALVKLPVGPFLRLKVALGGLPDAMGLAILGSACVLLTYGHAVTKWRGFWRPFRPALDLAVCSVLFIIVAISIADWAGVAFLLGILVAFCTIWLLLTQQGPWQLRVGLLCFDIVALVVGFLLLRARTFAHLLLGAILLIASKELLLSGLPRLWQAMRSWRVLPSEAFADAPLRPLITSLAIEPLDPESCDYDKATAAAVAAAARASLYAHRISAGGGASVSSQALSGSLDKRAWEPWVARQPEPGCEEDDVDEESTGAEGDDRENVDRQSGVSYDLNGVSCRLDDKRMLLKDLSFAVPPGSSVAIMGASGSGKTTLLSVLSGRCGDRRFVGEMRLNGTPILPWQMAHIRPLFGYVPQDDVLHTTLTVRENIEFQAQLRLPPEKEEEAKAENELESRVELIISGLGLSHVSHRAVCDGLSGGQRKRASIGMELVARPHVLLLDEPSTGLDSATSHRIIEMVLQCAKEEACTTFATIHQPRWATLGLFDMLVLLIPGGYLCFAGPTSVVKAYFTEVLSLDFPHDENPADVIIDASTFASARKMAVDGLWKSPPQCLRAVLFPTPEAASRQHGDEKTPWQLEEFGKILAALWSDFSTMQRQTMGGGGCGGLPASGGPAASLVSAHSAVPVGDARLATAAAQHAQNLDWAQQVWIHVSRTLLLTSRSLPAVALFVGLMMFCMWALLYAFPGNDSRNVFLKTALAFLLLGLSQAVPAQRIFGNEDRSIAWREGCVSSLSQVFFGFIGKDLASLLEINLASLCFTLTYWTLSQTLASGSDVFIVTFAFIYCVWGLNYILAITFSNFASALLLAVVTSFLSFLFCGMKPEAHRLIGNLGSLGGLVLLASPVRWAFANFMYMHLMGRGSSLLESELIKQRLEPAFLATGFSLRGMHNGMPDTSKAVLRRWAEKDGWLSHCGQLFLLGVLFRFLAVSCLLLLSSSKAAGGELPLGIVSVSRSRLLRDALLVFLIFFTIFSILLLGQTS